MNRNPSTHLIRRGRGPHHLPHHRIRFGVRAIGPQDALLGLLLFALVLLCGLAVS